MQRRLTYSTAGFLLSLIAAAPLFGGANPVTVSIVPSASPAPPPSNSQPLNIVVTLSGTAGTPTGTVKLWVDGVGDGGFTALDGTGSHTFTITDASIFNPGNHQVGIDYSGDSNYAAATPNILVGPPNPITVAIASPITVLSNLSLALFGQPITYTATLTPGAFPITGTVTFFDSGVQIGSPVSVASNQASSPALTPTPGLHSITASYSGDAHYPPATSPSFMEQITKDVTTISTPVLSGTPTAGNPLSFTATVTVTAPGVSIPTGTVTFKDGSTTVGAGQLSAGGTASITTSTLAAGVHGINATYSGDADNFGVGPSATLFFTVAAAPPPNNPPPSTPPTPPVAYVSLTSNSNPVPVGQQVTFTANVTWDGGSGTPASGTVQFLDGSNALGTSAVNPSTGLVTFSTSTLTAGIHTITAKYSGDNTFPAAQATLRENVSGPATTTGLTVLPASAVFGQAVTLTASIGPNPPPSGSSAPTGTVTFLDGSNSLGNGTVSSGAAMLSVNTLGVGPHTLTARYGGDSNWAPSQGTASVTVSQASTATAISLVMASGQLTLTAAVAPVAPGAGTPTGSVQFVDTANNNAVVATGTLSNGTVTATAPTNAASRPLAAVYTGDANFKASTSAALLRAISAAANQSASFAPDQAVSLFNVSGLTGDTPATFPLTTTLGGASVNVTDSGGTSRLAQLYGVFASASQINFVVPSATAFGPASFTVTLPGGAMLSTVVTIAPTAPSIFTANMNGTGVYAGQIVNAHADGTQTTQSSATFNSATNTWVATPVNFGPATDQVYLVLYGTGIRHAASGAVTATVNGTNAPVAFAAQGQYPALDQVNLQVPRSLAGSGTVNIVLSAAGQTANTVTATFQ